MAIDRRAFVTLSTLATLGVTLPLRADCRRTSSAIEGPYWRPDAPRTNDLRRAGGEPVYVHGVLRDTRSCKPLANARIDVWQADHHGKYDVDYGGKDVFGRASLRSAVDGSYGFWTIRPAAYGMGRSMRPAHIHFLVEAPGTKLITQLYFEGDPQLDSDPLDAVHPDLVKAIVKQKCAFDIAV